MVYLGRAPQEIGETLSNTLLNIMSLLFAFVWCKAFRWFNCFDKYTAMEEYLMFMSLV